MAALSGCGGAGSPDAAGAAERVAAAARAIDGVDDVAVVPADDGVTQVHLVVDARDGVARAREQVDRLVAASSPPAGVEIWVDPATTADADLTVRVYPEGTDPAAVGSLYLVGATPGVVSASSAGGPLEVRVGTEDDLAVLADVITARHLLVASAETVDGASTLAALDELPQVVPPTIVPLPWPADPGASACTDDDLTLSLGGGDATTGHRAQILTATNTGPRPCSMGGYPTVAFRSLDGTALEVTVEDGGSFMASDPGPSTVVVPVGARVLSVLGWTAMPTAGVDDVTSEIELGVGTGLPMHRLAMTSSADVYDSGPQTTLDIVDAGSVAVTAWAPEGTRS